MAFMRFAFEAWCFGSSRRCTATVLMSGSGCESVFVEQAGQALNLKLTVDQKIAAQKVKNYYDLLFVEETTRYVFRILALKMVMEDPEKYGFSIEKKQLYPIIETENVQVKGPVKDWAAFAIEKGITYKTLKMFNPWLRETFLKNPARKTYTLKIPEKGFRTQ